MGHVSRELIKHAKPHSTGNIQHAWLRDLHHYDACLDGNVQSAVHAAAPCPSTCLPGTHLQVCVTLASQPECAAEAQPPKTLPVAGRILQGQIGLCVALHVARTTHHECLQQRACQRERLHNTPANVQCRSEWFVRVSSVCRELLIGEQMPRCCAGPLFIPTLSMP